MNIISDYHIHTNHSWDCKTPMENIKKVAAEKNIGSVAITDHHEIHEIEFFKPFKIKNFESYIEECRKYDFIAGIELGWDCTSEIDIDLDRFDFVILSVHGFEDETGKLNWKKYFDDILFAVNHVKRFDVLGHLDFPRRYVEGFPEVSKEYFPVIEEIFKSLIKNDRGIEVNTSGMRKYGDPNPGWEIVKLYNSLGGKVITLGSDAHYDFEVGERISDATEILFDLGFDKISVFENGEMIQKNIKTR